jgi:hypothetical protein
MYIKQSPAGSGPVSSFWPIVQNELTELLENLRLC